MNGGPVLLGSLAAAAVVALVTALAPGPGMTGAQDLGDDLTFRGQTSTGTTIVLTMTADRAGITRAAVEPTTRAYYDPPTPIVDDQFSVAIPDFGSIFPHRMAFTLEGTLVSETEVSGTGRYCGLVPPGLTICTPDFSWNASGPVDTPPGPDDAVLEGTVEDGSGRLVVTTTADGTGITSFMLDSVALPPCTDPDNPLDIRAFFEPPLAVADGLFEGGMGLASLQFVNFTGTLLDGAAEGTLNYRAGIFVGDCAVEVRWSAAVPGAPAPSATPTASASPVATSPSEATATAMPAVSPTSVGLPSELPGAGAGVLAPGLARAIELGLLGCSALALGGSWLARRQRR